MADLHLQLTGDASGASGAMHDAAEAGGHAEDKFHDLNETLKEMAEKFTFAQVAASALETGLETLKDGIKESWEEAAKAETAHRQLAAAAGELTDKFKEQAEAIGSNLGVKAEDIEHMQTLLLRYGAAPETIGKATEAVLNYAAATGQDANSAMMMLIRGVEAGHGSLGRMGVKFKETGEFAGDLGNAVQALNDKFGGSAEIEAGGMTGRVRAATLAWDELKKSFGEFLALAESKLHVLQGVTEILKTGSLAGLGARIGNSIINGGDPFAQTKKPVEDVEGTSPFQNKGVELSFGELEMGPSDKAKKQGQKLDDTYSMMLVKAGNFQKKWQDEWDTFDITQDNKEEERLKKEDDWMLKSNDEMLKAFDQQQKDHTKDLEELGKMQFEMMKGQTDKQQQELEKRRAMWLNLGEQIGVALINGIFGALANQNGQAENAWTKAGKVTRDIFVMAFQAVSSAFGMGFIGQFAQSGMSAMDSSGGDPGAFLMAMSGSGSGFSSGISALNKGQQTYSDQQLANSGYTPPPSQHSGGWMRYHNGGWPGLYSDEMPAILQAGERVLSRGEVARMGGSQAVDGAARGGGVMNVYAWDSENMLDTFARKGGRAMLNTVRTGKGPLREMFGGN